MNPSELPESLSEMTADDLTEARDALREGAAALAEQALDTDEAVEALEAFADSVARVEAELADRAAADEERAERAAAAADKLGLGETAEPAAAEPEAEAVEEAAEPVAADTDDTETAGGRRKEKMGADETETAAAAVEDPEPQPSEPATEEPAAAETAAAEIDEPETPAADDTEPEAAASTEAAPEAGADTTAEAAAIEEAPETEETTTEEPSAPAAAQPAQEAATMTQPTTDPVAGMTVHRPADVAPAATDGRGDSRQTAIFRATASNGREMADHELVGTDENPGGRAELATLVHRKFRQLQQVKGTVGREPIVLATAATDFDHALGDDHVANHAVIESIRNQATALVASGGNCAPLAPRYDVFSVAEPQSPVEEFLPALGAPRGGIRYVQGVDWSDAQAGVRFTTEAEDAAGYPPTEDKPCVTFECPDVVECEVGAVSRCVTFGNLNYRTFPELIETHLDHLAVAFAEEKEVVYLDAIDAGSTAITGGINYGAARSAYFTLALALHAYRKRNHMSVNAPLQVLAPDSMAPFLAADMVNDHSMGLGFLRERPETIGNEIFRALGGTVGWYYDGDSSYSASNQMKQAQAAGAINSWPCDFRVYIFAPGTWARLDGGTLDVGVVRDSALNATNDLQMFAEQWVQACRLGNESIRLDLTLSADGTGPDPVTPITSCDDYS